MMSLEGKLFVLDSFIKNFQNDLLIKEIFDRELMSSISAFSDLSQFTDENNLYNTGYNYSLDSSTLTSEIEIILSKEYCLILSQAYEIFETYLLNIFTELLFAIPDHLVTLNLLEVKLHLPKKSLRDYVKNKIGRPKNNRKYISSLRKLSKHFKEHETKNIYNLNIYTILQDFVFYVVMFEPPSFIRRGEEKVTN